MPTSLSNITVKDSNHSLVIKSNDITIDGTSILGQNNFADRDLSNLSTTGQNILDSKLDTTQITNCITEISQDIKLELNDGTLKLKAGSKFYVPNGKNVDGSLKFDAVVIESDKAFGVYDSSSNYLFLCIRKDGSYFITGQAHMSSGTTIPTDTGARNIWYDTDNNIIKTNTPSSSEFTEGLSLPIAIIGSNSTSYTSINQVFNGFGYIGSTVFALPGVKGLIPNGRNTDGTLMNEEFTVGKVRTYTNASSRNNSYLALSANDNDSVGRVNNFEVTDDISQSTKSKIIYSPTLNKNIISGGKEWKWGIVGQWSSTSTSPFNVTSLRPKTAFHAVDYNDFKQADDNNVKLTGNQTIGGIKTFADNVFIENAGSRYITKNTSMTRGTYNSSQSESKIVNQDRNGKLLSEIRTYVESSDSATSLCLGAITEDSSGNQLYKTVFRGTARKDGTSVVSLEGVSAVYVPTPPTTDSSTKIATTANVDAKITAQVVKLTGNQTVAGTKVFTDQSVIQRNLADTRLICKNTGIQQGTAPSSNQYSGYRFLDKNNVELGTTYSSYLASGSTRTALYVKSPVAGATNAGELTISCDANGNFYTSAPTPGVTDNSTKIATTAFVNNKFQVVSTLPSSPDSNVFYFIPA